LLLDEASVNADPKKRGRHDFTVESNGESKDVKSINQYAACMVFGSRVIRRSSDLFL